MVVRAEGNCSETDETLAAVRALQQGKPVIFPTETVYGLGISVLHALGPQILFELKGRPQNKPVAWLVASVEDICRYGDEVPAYAFELAERFWPGALTLIVKAAPDIPDSFCSAQRTVGLRMPDCACALKLIELCGCPLATTSANMSGGENAAQASALDAGLVARVEVLGYVLPGEVKGSGVASTVVDCSGSAPRVLRQGQVSIDAD